MREDPLALGTQSSTALERRAGHGQPPRAVRLRLEAVRRRSRPTWTRLRALWIENGVRTRLVKSCAAPAPAAIAARWTSWRRPKSGSSDEWAAAACRAGAAMTLDWAGDSIAHPRPRIDAASVAGSSARFSDCPLCSAGLGIRPTPARGLLSVRRMS